MVCMSSCGRFVGYWVLDLPTSWYLVYLRAPYWSGTPGHSRIPGWLWFSPILRLCAQEDKTQARATGGKSCKILRTPNVCSCKGQFLLRTWQWSSYREEDLYRFNNCSRIFKDTYLGLYSSLPLDALDRMGLLFTHHIIGRLNSSAFLVEQTMTTRIYPFSPLSGSEMKTFF